VYDPAEINELRDESLGFDSSSWIHALVLKYSSVSQVDSVKVVAGKRPAFTNLTTTQQEFFLITHFSWSRFKVVFKLV